MIKRIKTLSAHEKQAGQVVIDEMTLDGQMVVVQIVDIPIEDLRLDPKNPRIANRVATASRPDAEPTQAYLQDELWGDPDVRDLYRQIQVNGGLIERIIVRSDFTVAEGNCRLVAYRKLHEKFPKDETWRRIPARILPSNASERSIALLLAQMHVMGKNQWSPFEKAGHVYKLYKDFMLTQDEIASRLKMSKSQVNNFIHAFEAISQSFLPRYPSATSTRKFSYFLELYKNHDLKKWIQEQPSDRLGKFCEWVGTEKLNQGAQVRLLPKILANRTAVVKLESEGFEEARKVLGQDDPGISSTLFKKMLELTASLQEARLDDLRRANPDENRRGHEIAVSLQESLSKFIEMAVRTS